MNTRATSWFCLAVLICCCCLPFGTASRLSAQEAAGDQGAYVLGTATTGGAYHPVGVALSTLIKLKLLPEFGVDLTAVNTDGSRQNVGLLRDDDIQFAIISALAGHEARNGVGEFAGAGSDEGLRAITTLWLSTDHLLIRDDAVKSGTINDFLELKGRPVSLGRRESSTLLENRTLMSAFGLDIERDFNLVELGYKESADALADGRIDGMSVSGGVPIGAVQDVYEELGDGLAALEINDEQLSLIDGGRGLWQRVVIPNGTYPGQDRDIFTIGTPNILAVRADVDEEAVYQITRTIFEELEYLHGLHDTTRQISLDNAVNNLPLPIHEGAARYFEEKGVVLPLPPMELDPNLLVRYPTVEDARVAANEGLVSMFAGTEGDTTTQVAAELASVLNSDNDDVRLVATNGGGVGQNLTDLLYLKGVDTALVRADLLNYAQEQAVYPTFENQVNYISEMFPEEVHLLVRDDIIDLADLTGKKVNLGTPETGASVTASILLSQLGVRTEPTFFDPRMAIEKLEQGEISAAFLVGGKPMPLLRQIDGNSGLKLIAIPAVDYFDSYVTAEIPGYDYPNLMQPNDVVPTIAVRTALLTYAWRPRSNRYETLGSLTNALFESLLILHGDGYHPKWREVDPTAEFAGWQRFQPASNWIDDNQGTARRITSEGRSRLDEQQRAQPVDIEGGEAEPFLTNNDAEAARLPEGQTDESAPHTAIPSIDAATKPEASDEDAAAVPTAPVIELTPNVEPASERSEPSSTNTNNDAASESSATEQSVTTRPAFSNVPTTGVKAPTF